MRLGAWAQLTDYAPPGNGQGLAEKIWGALPEIPTDDFGGWLPHASATTFANALGANWGDTLETVPEWLGAVAETGSLARWRSHPALTSALKLYGRNARTRFLALLMDLAQCASYIAAGADDEAVTIDACCVAPGVGVARVETARGTLLHRVRVEENRVAEYSIVAPTEWNFHPRGAFTSAMLGAPATDLVSLRHQAAGLALALDPCVPFQIEIAHA